MVTREDIEAFLDRLSAEGASYQELEPGLWVVRPGGALEFDVVVTHNPPVVLLRVKVMPLPADAAQQAALNRRLLELNASDLLHGSYGIDQDNVVHARPVKVTQQNETEAVIASGLSPADRVVTTGFANLSEGAKVSIGDASRVPTADLAPGNWDVHVEIARAGAPPYRAEWRILIKDGPKS